MMLKDKNDVEKLIIDFFYKTLGITEFAVIMKDECHCTAIGNICLHCLTDELHNVVEIVDQKCSCNKLPRQYIN